MIFEDQCFSSFSGPEALSLLGEMGESEGECSLVRAAGRNREGSEAMWCKQALWCTQARREDKSTNR